MNFKRKDNYSFSDLVAIVDILRKPDGCPWDAEQTHQSIRKSLIEETYEVAEAIDLENAELLQEELGDLLLQVVMHAQMESEQGVFTMNDVCDGVCKKLIYRHPHVFGNVSGLDTVQVLENWEKLKNAEKGRQTAADRLDSVPACLPALMRGAKVQKRAADLGFAYAGIEGAIADLDSEVAELKQAVKDGSGAADELGDVIFSAVNVSAFIKADAEEAMTAAINRFAGRIKTAEDLAEKEGKTLEQLTPEERDVFWKKAKAKEQAQK